MFGDVDDNMNYLLVSVPGGGSIPVNQTLTGLTGSEWRVVRDNGDSTNFFCFILP